jgi:hypothetical protein
MSSWGIAILLCSSALWAQQPAPPPKPEPTPAAEPESDSTPVPDAAVAATQNRTTLNLLGQTNAQGGESNRNQNVSITLVNNSAAQELNTRVGTTATIVPEFQADRGYFSAEYGNARRSQILALPQSGNCWLGNIFWTHNNSVFNARSFFQVGGVRPARQNQFGGTLGGVIWNGGFLSITGSQF